MGLSESPGNSAKDKSKGEISDWIVTDSLITGVLKKKEDDTIVKDFRTSKINRVKKEDGGLYVFTSRGSVYELTDTFTDDNEGDTIIEEIQENRKIAMDSLIKYLERHGIVPDLNQEEFEYTIP